MHIFVVNGSPRKNGVTDEILKYFCFGASDEGGTIDQVDLRQKDIRTCSGCFSCWNVNEPLPCIHQDEMIQLLERFLKSDTVVFASPVYFYNFSANLKIFLERLMPLTRPLLSRGSTLGNMQNSMHLHGKGPKRCVLLCVAGHRDQSVTDGMKQSFSMMADALGLEISGMLCRPESFFFDFPKRRPGMIRSVRDALRTAGKELVQNGKISLAAERAVAAPLTRSNEEFRVHYNNYWQIAGENGFLGSEGKKIRKAVNRDMRTLMPSLELCFDPRSAAEMGAVFVFELSGQQPGTWCVDINNGTCEVSGKCDKKPDIIVKTSSENLTKFLSGTLDTRYAVQSGKLVVDGDMSLLSRFGKLFSKRN